MPRQPPGCGPRPCQVTARVVTVLQGVTPLPGLDTETHGPVLPQSSSTSARRGRCRIGGTCGSLHGAARAAEPLVGMGLGEHLCTHMSADMFTSVYRCA